MNKQSFSTSQKGFAQTAIIIITILVFIAGLGYFSYKQYYCDPSRLYALGSSFERVRDPFNLCVWNSAEAVKINHLDNPTPEVTNTDQTANWKTYSNTKYGFEIQHPWTEI